MPLRRNIELASPGERYYGTFAEVPEDWPEELPPVVLVDSNTTLHRDPRIHEVQIARCSFTDETALAALREAGMRTFVKDPNYETVYIEVK